jgi:uncharacterized coiled-coil protein SlyX
LQSAFPAKHDGSRNLNMHDRLTNIEVKIAHMEQALAELSDVLYSQQQLLDRLANGMDRLTETAALAADSPGNPDAATEKPPHY